MGKKAERRSARAAAAQVRDEALREAGNRDPFLFDWLQQSRRLAPAQFERMRREVERDAASPSCPNHKQAVIALGALRRLDECDALERARAAQPLVPVTRAGAAVLALAASCS